jgi:hypothetical protein
MTAYTKTTNFAAKDSLLVGNPAKVIKGTEHNVEYDNIATAVNSKANASSPTFTGTANFANIGSGAATGLTLNNSVIGGSTPAAATFSTFTLASGATVTAILDEDALTSNSATALATQQSVKAYVDAQVIAAGPLLTTGTITANDFARFTDATTLEGRSAAEVRADLDLEIGTDVQAFDTDTAKLDVIQTFTAAQTFTGATLAGNLDAAGFDLLNIGGVTNDTTDKGSIATGTVTFDVSEDAKQKLTVTGALTIAFSGWPTTGNYAECEVELVNGGAATVTLPTINWIVGNGTTSTTFADTGVTLVASGTNHLVVWSTNAGTTLYGVAG